MLEHLEELRRRLLQAGLWWALATALCWRFAPFLLRLLLQPAGPVVFVSPVEPFLLHLKAALLGGLFLSFPLIALEGWGFLQPALGPGERRLSFLFVPASAGLFLLGGWFGWAVLLPAAFGILLAFGEGLMTPMLTAAHAAGFALWLVAGCGLIFQTPLVILILARIGWVSPPTLLRQWRLAALVILVVAAVLTPSPDVVTQLLLAAPLTLLYLLSAGLACWVRPVEPP